MCWKMEHKASVNTLYSDLFSARNFICLYKGAFFCASVSTLCLPSYVGWSLASVIAVRIRIIIEDLIIRIVIIGIYIKFSKVFDGKVTIKFTYSSFNLWKIEHKVFLWKTKNLEANARLKILIRYTQSKHWNKKFFWTTFFERLNKIDTMKLISCYDKQYLCFRLQYWV